MIQENAQQVEAWEITSGRHRFEAAWRMNYTTVPSVVVDEDDLHAKLAMIAEHLHRAELTALERANQSRGMGEAHR
jgi:ParB-like chromosome segregation protein Spo0J